MFDGFKSISPDEYARKVKYQTYLETEHWQEFSRKAKRDRNFQCENCKVDQKECFKQYRQGLNVHHKTYKNLGKETMADVEVLCYRCHMEKHGAEDWVDFCQTKKFPVEVSKIPIFCKNCAVRAPFDVHSMDEIVEWFCWDCR